MKKYLFLILSFLLLSEFSFAQVLYSVNKESIDEQNRGGLSITFTVAFDGGNEYNATVDYNAWCNNSTARLQGSLYLINHRTGLRDDDAISEIITTSKSGTFYSWVRGWGPEFEEEIVEGGCYLSLIEIYGYWGVDVWSGYNQGVVGL